MGTLAAVADLTASMHLEPALRVLLLLARPRLEAHQVEWLRESLESPACDKGRLLDLAQRHHLSLLVQAHLHAHAPGCLSSELQARFDRTVSRLRLRHMEKWRVQSEVLGDLQQLKADHALLKGESLSTRYYGAPLRRQSRDVDILVDARALPSITRALLDRGYSICNKAWPTLQPPCIEALCNYSGAVELRAPSGVVVELHRLVDHSGCLFNPRELLRRRVTQDMFGQPVPALAAEDELLHATFHHARHGWTLLHWVADLQGFRPHFAEAGLWHLAARRGLAETLRRALCLVEAVDGFVMGREPSDATLARMVPAWSNPAAATEVHEHADAGPDFGSHAEAGWRYRGCFWLKRWRPSINDYRAWPLPPSQRWVYWLVKPARVWLRRSGVGRCRGDDA